MACDPATLMREALCISQCVPPGFQTAILINLACQILNNTSGGGGAGFQQIYQSNGDPNGVVTVNTSLPCMCIDLTNHIVWTKTDGIVSNTGWGSP